MNKMPKIKFINSEAQELAKRLHKEEHLIICKKIKKNHKLFEWYYLMASGIYQNLIDKIDSDNVEIYNLIIDLGREIKDLKEEMKELSKQQKYLWQTYGDYVNEGIKKEN